MPGRIVPGPVSPEAPWRRTDAQETSTVGMVLLPAEINRAAACDVARPQVHGRM